ncbi:purple acid phosphatase 13 [Striga asiatica]|uniref:Purple acid phosphatase 13 n=1 Tax=Striga asiatica TaxID=4170 RepID=A0A5A7RJ41_STRAF|nr:purple acid phosphatase 13 [Striga asiatica]
MASKTVEASFPSNLERTVASALLLLSRSAEGSSPESLGSSGFSAVKSNGGWVAAEVCVDEESAPAQQLTVVAFVSGFDELDLKIVRKKRSKTICISDGKKLKSSEDGPTSPPPSSESVSGITTVEASCMSSSSSSQSFCSQSNADDKPRRSVIAGHLGRTAAAILGVLSKESASEVKIRHLIGDSPSTSKALRIKYIVESRFVRQLLKLQEVKRYGAGGRTDPYIYTVKLL